MLLSAFSSTNEGHDITLGLLQISGLKEGLYFVSQLRLNLTQEYHKIAVREKDLHALKQRS